MQQRIEKQSGIFFELKKGQLLHVIDPQGQQVADLFCFSKDDATDALSSGRSIDDNDTIFFTQGHTLFSQSGKAMLKIVRDQCGRHDFLVTPCSQLMFEMISGKKDKHPSCLENLQKSFQGHGVNLNQIGTTFNIFMNIEVSGDGRIQVQVPKSKAGDQITFEAQMDLLVALTACSDEGTNGGTCKPILFEVESPKN